MGTFHHQECDGCGADTGHKVGFCEGCEAERKEWLASHGVTAETLLRELVDWAREHTSPLDANSPHAILVRAQNYLKREG